MTDALELAAGKALDTAADDPATIPEGGFEEGRVVTPHAATMIPCSQTGFTANLMQRFAFGNRAGVPGAVALLDRSSSSVYTAAGMPSGPMTHLMQLFNDVWYNGRATQRRLE